MTTINLTRDEARSVVVALNYVVSTRRFPDRADALEGLMRRISATIRIAADARSYPCRTNAHTLCSGGTTRRVREAGNRRVERVVCRCDCGCRTRRKEIRP